MSLFLSRYLNGVDKKGRVSVPSSYRQASTLEGFAGVVLYPSIRNKSIEACTLKRLNELAEMIYNLDPYSEERDAFETIILGESVQLAFDPEGRIVLPKHLVEFAEIDQNVSFVGKGQIFEIWNPVLLDSHLAKVKEIAANNKGLLKNIHQGRVL
jgi:MraZ protein